MKKRFTRILAALALLVGLTIPMGMWGQTRESETITFADLGLENGVQYTDPFGTNISVTFAGGDNDGKYYTTGSGIRTYGGGTITITANDNTVTAISTTFSGESYAPASTDVWSCNGATTNSTKGVDASWSGSATEVVMTRPSGSGHWRMQAITVTYMAGGSTPTTYNVTVNQTTGGTIEANPTQATAGTNITLTATPAEGYSFDSWIITPTTVEINNNQFTMPASNVTVSASWTQNSGGGATSPATLTQSILGLTGAYTTNTNKTIDGITYVYTDLMKSNDNIQAKASTGTIKNTTAYPGDITSVAITHSGTARATTVNGSADGENWTQVATGSGSITADFSGKGYKYFQITRGSNAAYWTKIEIAWADANAPGISASDVDIAYDATSGSIAYTITNGVEGGAVTSAEVTASNPENWLTVNGSNSYASPISLSCAANTTATEKTATVTLTYTYNRETVTETVNVTQAANPNATMTIAEVRAQGTGNVVTKGVVTSCVGTTGYIQDANAAICVYGAELIVGNEIKVSGSLTTYKGLLEIENPQVTILSSGNTTNPEEMTIAEINASTNQGWYVRIVNATITAIGSNSNYTIAQGENTITLHGNLGVEVAENDIISLNGNIGCFNTVQIVNPQNVEVQAAPVVPTIAVTPDVVELDAAEHEGTLGLTYENLTITKMGDFAIQYYDVTGAELNGDDKPDWIEVLVAEQDPTIGEGYVVSYYMVENEGTDARTAYFKVYAMDDETNLVYSNLVTITQDAYVEPFEPVTYTLATTIESGRHYIIVNEGSSKAMGGQNDNNRAAVDVEIEDGVATVSSTDVYEFVINGPDKDGYYTIYDASVPGYLYAVGGTSKNYLKTETYCQAHGQWTINFNQETNAASVVANITGRNTMRYNSSSQIFSCYASGQNDIYLYVKDNETEYTIYKDIAGYGTGTGKYYLITSPIVGADPVQVGMITDDNTNPENFSYDLYWFDQTQTTEEWQNARQAASMSLASGNLGYLYANKNAVTLHFAGTPNTLGTVSLVKENVQWSGWNLVGNPFTVPAYIDRSFYRMNNDGTELIESSGAINPMEGIFVIANTNNEEMTFGTTAPTNVEPDVVVNVTNDDKVIDRAVVRFSQGSQLPKFQLNANSTKLYMLQGDKEMAIVSAQAEGEMPVSFRAAENGTYTLSVNPEGVEMNYLHLIDNMTGTDVDLLATPSYTFEANTRDYANRFKLVFKANTGVEENTATETFAYFNGTNWTVSNVGDATLQVVDMMGRVLSSETLSGNANVNINQAAGVYVLRLINGENVKVQKVVVR